MNILMLLILIFYSNVKYFDRLFLLSQTIRDKDAHDILISLKIIWNVIYSNWFFLCFFTLSIVLIAAFIFFVFKQKKMYFTKLLSFFEFILYIILLFSILNFNMEPRAIGEFMENGYRKTFPYIYNDKEMGFRLFLIFIIPILLSLLLLYFFICLFYIMWKKNPYNNSK
jgi:hypothetical protein